MSLFHDIGFLYDADKSTIRAYMYHDSVATSQKNHEKFYNINEDEKKFQPVLSRKKFLSKYKQYRSETDNTKKEHTSYNEVLGNFFPDSLVGLVAQENTTTNKLKLLQLKHLMSEKYNYDLPMCMMNNGKVTEWKPDLQEICTLISCVNVVKDKNDIKEFDNFVKN